MKASLVKYQCLNSECYREFISIESSLEVERTMSCPFCKDDVEAVASPGGNAQDLYEEMGCFYPGGGGE